MSTHQDAEREPEMHEQQPLEVKDAREGYSLQREAESLLRPPSPAALREELEQLVSLDLLGPAGGEDEEINEGNVRDRYIVGMLAPNYKQIQPEEQDELALADGNTSEDGTPDKSTPAAASFNPSSMGMSFCVDISVSTLKISVRWGRYKRTSSETLTRATGAPEMVWKRQQMGKETLTLTLKAGSIPSWSPEPKAQPEVEVKGLVRHTEQGWMVTLFLVNGQREPERLRDAAWIFQPELSIEAPDQSPIFRARVTPQRKHLSEEEQTMAMLYRRYASFAIGHGTGIHAETLQDDPTRAIRLSTCAIPSYEVMRTEAPSNTEIPGLAELVLDMKELAACSSATIGNKLMPLATAYATWIDEQRLRIDDPEARLTEHRHSALEALKECTSTLERIRLGIGLLATNTQAMQAFTFMNQAMWRQRVHTLYAEARRREQQTTLEVWDTAANRSWRPFQLAFILLNLPALADLHHPDRSVAPTAIADLLWFPTGGGKTEAYLGLTAYTLAIRRLQGEIEGRSGEDGVAVIMRYTLRLLTLQQFQRAAALICACEMIRRSDTEGKWGKTPFRLGLWVGQRTTPNTTEQSEEASKQDRGHYQRGNVLGGIGTPHQLTNCPWCGTRIDAGRDIRVERFSVGRGRTLTYCGDPTGRCDFNHRNAPTEGLPVLVVDEEIYRCLPSLLIATVDKFAQMPWNGATQMLFGHVDKYCSRHGFRSPDLEDKDIHRALRDLPAARSVAHRPLRPPDLIIQDELHLISGPLGTLVGLYESVVDRLSTWEVDGKPVRPKVIAATATIRRAEQQVQALFMRQVNIFPPNGLDASDNFFARQRPSNEETPGRKYIGICANGRRLKATLIRVYVAYLSAGQYLYNRYGQAADPWMTLVGYFNSINELGGMRRLVEDDVRSRLGKMERRGMATRHPPSLEELTSRKSSTDIPRVLDLLERGFDQNKTNGAKPLDVLLATNMISVGVDVKRLGLMVVTGQPKTTAEYIQATSRVGRNHPGLVCVVFNWTRPRDLSHYEKFEHYHATFYQQVEALSVTPFAPRALDRGLAALLVSYVRLLGSEFNENSQAGNVYGEHPYFTAAIDELTQRATSITGSAEIGASVHHALQELKDYWLNKTKTTSGGAVLSYKMKRDDKTTNLLHQAGNGDWLPFTCLNSLRDVEPSVNLVLDDRSLGDHVDSDVEEHTEKVGVNTVHKKYRVGELRPSQALFTYGVGSIIDLPHISTMVMGLDDWPNAYGAKIGEERLLQAVQTFLGPQTKQLLSPPAMPDQGDGTFNPLNEGSTVGIHVAPFPRWMLCPRCRRLASLDSGLFHLKADLYRVDRIRYVHTNCSKAIAPPVLPARFLIACENGHLDDFPWVYFVHKGETECPARLKLREVGVSGEAAEIEVECEVCGAKRRMSDAFGVEGKKSLPPCNGRRPHLRDYEVEACEQPVRTILLGASNSWFPIVLSTLAVPTAVDTLGQLVDEHWHILENATSQQNIALLRSVMQLPRFTAYRDEEIWGKVEVKRNGKEEETQIAPTTLKVPEWQVLSNPAATLPTHDFKVISSPVPSGYEHLLKQVVLVERLRVVQSLIGFTRIESPGDATDGYGNTDEQLEERRVPLSRRNATWVPTAEVRGEGIFIEFREDALNKWFYTREMQQADRSLWIAHRRWRAARHIKNPEQGFPGLRYVLLHSFAHALIRQLTLECGYATASIRERIYSLPGDKDGGPMAGILLYTSAPDSEGTLGGLVGLGTPEQFGRHIEGALEQMQSCASDPLCAEHTVQQDNTLHEAACHACLFIPETSCERGNKYLDRSVLVPTVAREHLAFFGRRS
jgi:hypothetical protein